MPRAVFLDLLSGGSAASIEGALPLTAIGEANFAYPFLFYFYKRSEATFVAILNRQSQSKFKNTVRGVAALTRLVKLGFRRWLLIENAMACVLYVRTHCVFQSETPYQAQFHKPRESTKFEYNFKPLAWLFSGWNWVATTLPLAMALVNFCPPYSVVPQIMSSFSVST